MPRRTAKQLTEPGIKKMAKAKPGQRREVYDKLAPGLALRVTLPKYFLPTSGTAVSSSMIWIAFFAASPSDEAIDTVPLSSTSIFTPVRSMMLLIILPPGPGAFSWRNGP